VNTTTGAVLTAVTVMAGRFAEDKPFDPKLAIAGAMLAVTLAALSQANEKLAGQFALLIFVGTLLRYGVSIGKKVSGK
jgi:hypothetical protein